MGADDETETGSPGLKGRPLNERAAEREARRAAALRANLRRRKAQGRARQETPAGEATAPPSAGADRCGRS